MTEYELIVGTPSVDDYRRLRRVSGLSEKTQAAAEAGLPNTWFAVTIHHVAAGFRLELLFGVEGELGLLTLLPILELAHATLPLARVCRLTGACQST